MVVKAADEKPNLAIVDEAFGPGSDLYLDVLQVQPNAGTGQIQDAYFDRRNELFQLLADIDGDHEQDSITESHRRNAERKMDAVVCSVRILGDPDLRLQYDDLRSERLHAKRSPKRTTDRNSHSSASPKKGGKSKSSTSSPRRTANHRVPMDEPSPEDEARDMRLRVSTSHSSSMGSTTVDEYPAGRYALNSSLVDGSLLSTDPSTLYTVEPVQTRPRSPAKNLPPRKPPVVSPEKKNSSKSRRTSNNNQKQQLHSSARGAPPTSRTMKAPTNNSKRNKQEEESVADSQTLESESGTLVSDDEDETFFTIEDASISDSILAKTSKKPDGFLDRVRIEAIGACDDTARSFAQVCNVFTLQESDIKAVMGRIDKASRQLHGTAASVKAIGGGASGKTSSSSRATSRGRKSPAAHSNHNNNGRKSPAASMASRRSKSAPKR